MLTPVSAIPALRVPVALAVVLAVAAGGCGKKGDAKPTPPARVEKPGKEVDIGTITLTPEAETRLGVRVAPIEKRKVARSRSVGGEAVVPPGARITVSAPTSGVLGLSGGKDPRPGAAVAKGEALFVLSLTASERVKFAESTAGLASSRSDAEGAVAKARVELETAKIALERAEKLAVEQVGSAQRVDEARAQMRLAQTSLASAESWRRAIGGSLGSSAGATGPITIESPMRGILHRVYALPGQVVAAGAPLFEVAWHDPMWIRVPVYVGDLAGIDATKDALVGALTGAPSAAPRTAKPVAAPPSASPTAATIDLFYELANADGAIRPGQSVGVTLAAHGDEESLVAPWASVVHDIYGGTWVYENTAPHTFIRRRVQVRHVVGSFAALETGPKQGTNVVTDGAAEIFGTELGMGK